MQSSIETWLGDDDLSRQRRKREARMLDGEVPDFPGLTVADVVADVLVVSNEGGAVFDVPDYLVGARPHIDDDQDRRRVPPTRPAAPFADMEQRPGKCPTQFHVAQAGAPALGRPNGT